MISSFDHQSFGSSYRVSQSLCNERCQNVLYKAIFEHFIELEQIAVLLLASKSFQNSSFGANFLANFVVDENSINLLESLLTPSSCFSMQFVPSLHIQQWSDDPKQIHRSASNFVSQLVKTKYLHLSLRSLTLRRVTTEVWRFFGRTTDSWPKLLELRMEGAVFNLSGFEILSKNALQLRTLSFAWMFSSIKDANLEHLSKLTNITSLNLGAMQNITDSRLIHIAKLRNISDLNLFNCNLITDAGLERISTLSGITSLDLSFCNKITDAGLTHISKLCNITSLNLGNCISITDAGVEHLAKLSDITYLCLYNCKFVTDVGVQHVAHLSNIAALNLAECKLITNASLDAVSNLPSITALDIYNCDKISPEAKQKLCETLPNCEIN